MLKVKDTSYLPTIKFISLITTSLKNKYLKQQSRFCQGELRLVSLLIILDIITGIISLDKITIDHVMEHSLQHK